MQSLVSDTTESKFYSLSCDYAAINKSLPFSKNLLHMESVGISTPTFSFLVLNRKSLALAAKLARLQGLRDPAAGWGEVPTQGCQNVGT